MLIKCNPSTHHWQYGSFRPGGKIVHTGSRENPETWSSKSTLAARIFVGFKVGGKVRWKMADLVKIVRAVRTQQSGDPSSTFLAQTGIYKHSESGVVVTEPGAQVILLDSHGATRRQWEEQILELAEIIAEKLKQESVVVEIQRNGLSLKTFGVAPA